MDEDDVLEDHPELWGHSETVKSNSISNKTSELSKKAQINAIRRFDNHFKKLNEHLWWIALWAKILLAIFAIGIFASLIALSQT